MVEQAFPTQAPPASGQAAATHFVPVDGCFNFRDLGGYQTRDGRTVAWRTLFRSDGLHRITDEGASAFLSLDISTVLDLRTPAEVELRSWSPPPAWTGRRHHLPLLTILPDWSGLSPEEFDGDDLAADHYYEMVHSEGGAAALRSALDLLAGSHTLPALFHCAAGKDRTGILAALVLGLIGVPNRVVAEDYALSDAATARWAATLRDARNDDISDPNSGDTGNGAWNRIPRSIRGAKQHTMTRFLDRLDADYGSLHGFTEHLGVPAGTIDDLHTRLLV
jgi:protein-tyrosine phosphatase